MQRFSLKNSTSKKLDYQLQLYIQNQIDFDAVHALDQPVLLLALQAHRRQDVRHVRARVQPLAQRARAAAPGSKKNYRYSAKTCVLESRAFKIKTFQTEKVNTI